MKKAYLWYCLCLIPQTISAMQSSDRDTTFVDSPSLGLQGKLWAGFSLVQRAYRSTALAQTKKYGSTPLSDDQERKIHYILPASSCLPLKHMNIQTADHASHFVLGTRKGLWIHPLFFSQPEEIQSMELQIGYEQTKQLDPELRRLAIYEGTCVPTAVAIRHFSQSLPYNPTLLKTYSPRYLRNASRALQGIALTSVIAGPWLLGKTDLEQQMHDHFLAQAHYRALPSATKTKATLEAYRATGNTARIEAIQRADQRRKKYQEGQQSTYFPFGDCAIDPQEKETLNRCIKIQQQKQYHRDDICKEEDNFRTPSTPCKAIIIQCTHRLKKPLKTKNPVS